jgi:DNA-binding transcriptional regulator YiaG
MARQPEILAVQGIARDRSRHLGRGHTYSVRDLAPRTARGWGMSSPEIKRVFGAMNFLRRTGLPCWYVVLGDSVLDKPEAEARAIFQEAASHLVQAQRRAGYPQYWLRVLESTGGLHSNMIFPASPEIAMRFKRSAFGEYCGGKGFQEIGATSHDWKHLASYLCTERTSQAEYTLGRTLGPRLKGSHRLGDGGGDRVHLSRAMLNDAMQAGMVAPWQRSKSKALTRSAGIAVKQPRKRADNTGQEQVASPRGPVTLSIVPTIPAVQLPLFPELPSSPPPFWRGDEVREMRQQIGKTQDWLATRLGLQRSHVANSERNHDRLSPQRRRLLCHIIEAERHAA